MIVILCCAVREYKSQEIKINKRMSVCGKGGGAMVIVALHAEFLLLTTVCVLPSSGVISASSLLKQN